MTLAGPEVPERILLVEDSPLQAAMVCEHLTQQGYQSRWETTLGKAREAIRDSLPDLLILDRILPDGDGGQWCRELKADPAMRDLPVIILTARDRVEERVEGLLGGADDYIPKPYHPEELLARVFGCLRTLALKRELRHKAEELARKNQELIEAQEQIIRMERLAAIGEIGLAIRHEINNPLGTILGYAQLLLQAEGLPSEVCKKLEAISRGAVRIRDVVRRLEDLREERTVEYLPGVSMTDLHPMEPEPGGGGQS
jgi:DNA-binding response OmpR family regulator